MPDRFRVSYPGGKLQIAWPWMTPKVLVMLAFCVLWDGFLVVWYSGALFASDGFALAALLFPLIHVTVGVVLTYVTIAGLFNTTTITATRSALHIAHAPLPWPGAGPVEGVTQLFSKERVHHTKNGGRHYTYELHAQLRSGHARKLIGRLEEASQSLWLEQALEQHLAIEDRPVGGEITRFG
jgi:hypothetical protein